MYVGGHVGQRIPESGGTIWESKSKPIISISSFEPTINTTQVTSKNGFVPSSGIILVSHNFSQVASSGKLIKSNIYPTVPTNIRVLISQSIPFLGSMNFLTPKNLKGLISKSQAFGCNVIFLNAGTYAQQDLFEYLRGLQPGETLTVNAEDLTVKLDGVNDRKNFDGAYPFLSPGEKILTYIDSETSRQIKIEIEKTDRTI